MKGWFARRKHRKLVISILEITRDAFVATHWVSGTLYQMVEVPVYEQQVVKGVEKSVQVGYKMKKVFCAVGGFCNYMLEKAGVPDELRARAEEAGLFHPSQLERHRAVGGFLTDMRHGVDSKVLEATFDAERALALAIAEELPHKAANYNLASPADVEGLIVEWNDSENTDRDEVVEMFDRAIVLAKEAL
jgi:hypothetical protein